MGPIEIIVIIVLVTVVSLIIGKYIYKRKKNLPVGECSCCSNKEDARRMFDKVRKDLDKECKCKK